MLQTIAIYPYAHSETFSSIQKLTKKPNYDNQKNPTKQNKKTQRKLYKC